MSDLYLADTSIWVARRRAPDLAERLVDRYVRGSIVTCAIIQLEALSGAPDGAALAADQEIVWRPLTQLPLSEAVCARALTVQAELACLGGRASRPLDFLVAACAELGGATLWHAEPHLAEICAVTGQREECDAEAVMPRHLGTVA